MEEAALFDILSRLLSYPAEDYLEQVEACRRLAEQADPACGAHLARFTEELGGSTTEQLQELFVQTFDLNPLCALEVGWQLFGDNYDRGPFLVKLKGELAEHGIVPSVELPDHLCHILPLLERMEPHRAAAFARTSVLPAVKKMLAGLEGKQSPYESILKGVACLVEACDVRVAQEVPHD